MIVLSFLSFMPGACFSVTPGISSPPLLLRPLFARTLLIFQVRAQMSPLPWSLPKRALLGHLAGSLGRAHDSESRGREFKLYIGPCAYFKQTKKMSTPRSAHAYFLTVHCNYSAQLSPALDLHSPRPLCSSFLEVNRLFWSPVCSRPSPTICWINEWRNKEFSYILLPAG